MTHRASQFLSPLLAIFFAATFSFAATIRTLDGKTYEGDLKVEEGFLIITAKGQNAVRVPVENLLRVNQGLPKLLTSGLILTDGTKIFSDRIISADDLTVRFFKDRRETSLPMDKIARLVFAPNGLAPTPPDAVGVILASGDFFEGEFKGYSAGKVSVSSVLFGLKELPPGQGALAVVFKTEGKLMGENVVKLANGSEFVCANLSFKKSGIQLDDRLVGVNEISEIRCSGTAVSLADLVTSSNDIRVDGSPSGVPGVLLNQTGERAVGLKGNGTVTLDLAGKFKSMTAFVGVPKDLAPALRSGLVVIGDGNELARVAPKSSIDGGAGFSVELTGIKSLSIKVLSERSEFGGSILLLDPLLIRAKR